MMHDWFKTAKLGIFIHWGLNAVNGIHFSWPIARGQISFNDYKEQRHSFTADKFDPSEWATLIKASGAKYAVLTTKHHDGFPLFDTQYTDYNSVKAAPCACDLVAPYCQAFKDAGIKVGLYFSNTDWADDDHLRVMLNMSQKEVDALRKAPTNFSALHDIIKTQEVGDDKRELEICWERFMTRYKGQIRELVTRHQPDVLWFDVMWMRKGFSWEQENVIKMISELSPNTICNNRLHGVGDYETPENFIPHYRIDRPWELCASMNMGWNPRKDIVDIEKNTHQIIRLFCECITRGGNLLLNIGPDEHGLIPESSKKRLLEIGRWTHKYAEAIYPTIAGLKSEYFLGGSTLSEDHKTLYLFAYDCSHGQLMLDGIYNPIKNITSLVNGEKLTHMIEGAASWLNIPGRIWIQVPQNAIDELCTVIKIEFEEPIRLLPLDYDPHSVGEQQ